MKKLTFRICRGECFAQRGGGQTRGASMQSILAWQNCLREGLYKKPFWHGCMTDELRACALSTVLRPQNGNAPHSLLIAGGAGRWRIGGAERY